MASDLSNIIQNELINTFESLLTIQSSIDEISLSTSSDISDEQCIEVEVNFKSIEFSSVWKFYLPTLISTKFEYFMLGGIGELKQSIDDEILDASKEIVSTIVGGLSTSINAQGFDDISNVQIKIVDAKIIQGSELATYDNLYKFNLSFNDDKVNLFILFEQNSLAFIDKITAGENISIEEHNETNATAVINQTGAQASILSLLGEDSTENLKLLFDVKLKLSVRLGSKTFLLKDIVNWDIGQIIELEQMVNEPLDILINSIKVGEGEAVIVEGKFGVKIKFIGIKKLEL